MGDYKTKSRFTIGLIIDGLYGMGSYQNNVWRGVIDAVSEENMNLVCFAGGTIKFSPYNEFEKYRNTIYKFINNKNIDGLIFTGLTIANFISKEEFQEFLAFFKPLPMISVGGPIPNYPSIKINNQIGLYDMLDHLIKKHSYRKIAFINGPLTNEDALERFNVYKMILKENQIPYDEKLVYTGNYIKESGIEAVNELLDNRKLEFDVIVGSNDNMALGALEELKKRDYRIPYDIAVAGFDNIQEASYINPPLTTVRQPTFEQGKQAAHYLIKKLKGEAVDCKILPTKVIYRQSCGCLLQRVTAADYMIIKNEDNLIIEDIYNIISEVVGEAVLIWEIDNKSELRKVLNDLTISFFDDLTEKNNKSFISYFDETLGFFINNSYKLINLQDYISLLRKYAIPYIINDNILFKKLENIIQQVRVLISEKSVRVEADKRFFTKEQGKLLDTIGHSLASTYKFIELFDIIEKELPRIGIHTVYISLFNGESDDCLTKCKLIFALHKGVRINLTEDVIYDPKYFYPPGFPKDDLYNLAAFSIYFKEKTIGFLLLEGDNTDGNIYESLFTKLCSSIEGALIFSRNKASQDLLIEQNKKIQNFIDPMINLIRNVAEIISEKMKSIQNISELTQNSWTKISETNTSIEEASKNMNKMIDIIKIIDDISVKINLVALNASIEAAHVGEKGKGFAIIAAEIRKLSDSTKKHAGEISGALELVSRSIMESVEIVKDSQSSFSELEKEISEILDALNTITVKMNDLEESSKSLLDVMNKK